MTSVLKNEVTAMEVVFITVLVGNVAVGLNPVEEFIRVGGIWHFVPTPFVCRITFHLAVCDACNN
jgi:hypothetical protein